MLFVYYNYKLRILKLAGFVLLRTMKVSIILSIGNETE